MNRRQNKKRDRDYKLTIVIGCDIQMRHERYIEIQKMIKQQVRDSNTVLLPAGMHVEAIIQQNGSRHIEIKQTDDQNNILRPLRGGET